tara:strand:- start:465 stop:1100 length:636 start_codon:yes stop_codon:yes gene_type:complete
MKLILLLLTPFLILCQNNSDLLNGNWNIISLEYSTEIDLELFQQDISGESADAGTCYFNSIDYTYSMGLNFLTEPLTISIPLVGDYDVPSFPVENSSGGNWTLINDENTLLTTDSTTGLESSYEIIALTNDLAIISGLIPFSQDIGGMIVDLEIDVEMILEKIESNSLLNELEAQKHLIKIVDLYGREMGHPGFQLHIYSDGSIEKKYLVK